MLRRWGFEGPELDKAYNHLREHVQEDFNIHIMNPETGEVIAHFIMDQHPTGREMETELDTTGKLCWLVSGEEVGDTRIDMLCDVTLQLITTSTTSTVTESFVDPPPPGEGKRLSWRSPLMPTPWTF